MSKNRQAGYARRRYGQDAGVSRMGAAATWSYRPPIEDGCTGDLAISSAHIAWIRALERRRRPSDLLPSAGAKAGRWRQKMKKIER